MERADVSVVPSGRDKFSDALPDTACLANFRLSLWDETERQPRRGGIFVVRAMKRNSSSVRSGICRPDGAGEFLMRGSTKISLLTELQLQHKLCLAQFLKFEPELRRQRLIALRIQRQILL